MVRILVLALMLVLLTSCVDTTNARRILTIEGYQEIQFTGYQFFSCGRGDFYHTGFIAIKNGATIEGTVCGGLFFKGSTIRFD